MNLDLLKRLTNAHAIPGYEKEVRDIMKNEFSNFDVEVSYDNLGSIIANKKGNGPKIMIAGHMDEVGFIVKSIDENGFLRFETAGGWWSQVMLAKTVVVTTDSGDKYEGIIGSTPPHILSVEERNKPVEITDMFIDLGAKDKDQVIKAGIQIGDMVTPKYEFTQMLDENFYAAKAFDNRVGCYVVCEVIKRLNDKKLDCDLYAVGTVQEEIGCRGAQTTANKINPQIAIAIDTGIAGDTPGVNKNKAWAELSKGPQITVMDAGTLSHVGLRKNIFKLCDELEIPYQPDFLKGGATDAAKMHIAHDGACAINISLATRYLHSQASVISIEDLNHTVDILVEFITRLNDDVFEEILNV